MIDNELHRLVTDIVDACVTEHQREVIFRDILLDLDEDTRTEIAYLIEDRFTKHGYPVPLSRVERYMAHKLKVAEWFVKREHLDDELDELLTEMEQVGLIDDEQTTI
jgi:hypothetical protein